MIVYHPALDPYHAAIRILRLSFAIGESIEDDRMRILDYYLLFPERIAQIRLPITARGWRARLAREENPYWFNGEDKVVFATMQPIFDAAVRLLVARQLFDHEAIEKGGLVLNLGAVPPGMLSLMEAKNEAVGELISFIRTELAQWPLSGPDGLKHRTGLMEYRYDIA